MPKSVSVLEEPPADWGPTAIDYANVPYPHPVEFLQVRLWGRDLRMAYMDVPPAADANGSTVVLFHGMNFFAGAYRDTIEELRQALHAFKDTYNRTWIVERHGYRTPAQVRADQAHREVAGDGAERSAEGHGGDNLKRHVLGPSGPVSAPERRLPPLASRAGKSAQTRGNPAQAAATVPGPAPATSTTPLPRTGCSSRSSPARPASTSATTCASASSRGPNTVTRTT